MVSGCLLHSCVMAALLLCFLSPSAHALEAKRGCPKRIVSLNLASDEILVDLVEGGRIAGITYLSANAKLSNVSERISGLNATVRANLETIVELEPDVVVLAKFSHPDFVLQLRNAGIRLVLLEYFESIDGIKKNIRLIGEAVCEQDKAAALIKGMETELEAISRTLPEKAGRPRVLYFSPAGFTAGGSIVGDIIEYAGGINVVAEAGIIGNRKISLEFIIELDPDVIVMNSYSPERPDSAKRLIEETVLKHSTAVKSGRVYLIDDKYLIGASHYVVNGIRVLHSRFYPPQENNEEINDERH